jgi:methionine sulfoxide reductase catalytic subunit
VGEDAVDVTKVVPRIVGIPPHVRVGRNRWFNLLWLLPIGFVILISAVAVAQGLHTIPSVEDFIARYVDLSPALLDVSFRQAQAC